MERKTSAILMLVSTVLLCYACGCADSGGLAIAGKASTLGLGGELTTGITPNVNARVGINALDVDFDEEFDDIEYDAGVDFSSVSALVDWHIFNDNFRISGGVISMDHKIDIDATPTGPEDIGGVPYNAAEIGTLSGDIEVDDLAPYVGIGWGDPMDPGKRWGFYCDFGVAFTNAPDVDLSANGTKAADPAFQANLAKERKDIEDDVDIIKFYPVLSIGLYYRF